MSTSQVTRMPDRSTPSGRVAAEIRAEMGRQSVSQRTLGRVLSRPQAWVSRRLGVNADVDLTFEEVFEIAEALGVSPQGFLSVLLPRLDSNQQPSGYVSAQVSDLRAHRRARVARRLHRLAVAS